MSAFFFKWLIGIPEHPYEIKETTEPAQSGEEETELRSVRLQNGIKEGVGSFPRAVLILRVLK